jgi:hypothetical protein
MKNATKIVFSGDGGIGLTFVLDAALSRGAAHPMTAFRSTS